MKKECYKKLKSRLASLIELYTRIGAEMFYYNGIVICVETSKEHKESARVMRSALSSQREAVSYEMQEIADKLYEYDNENDDGISDIDFDLKNYVDYEKITDESRERAERMRQANNTFITEG